MSLTRWLAVIVPALFLAGCGASAVGFNSLPVYGGGGSVSLKGVLSRPEGKGPFPAVALLHTCGGLNDTMTRFWPYYLAQIGYVSLAVDSLSPRGMQNCLDSARPPREVIQMVGDDAYGALGYLSGLAEVDKQRIGVMGFSLGGIAIADFVTRDFKTPDGLNFKAAVTVYGHCSARRPGTPPHPGDPKFPWLIINGEKEQESYQVPCRSLQERPGVTYALIDGAYHGFDNPRNFPMRDDGIGNQMLYSEAATRKAQVLVKDFLQQHLGK